MDKTSFISTWWKERDKVTLICRPPKFGKTLALSMVERFFSNRYDRDETMRLFTGLDVTRDPEMMALMGTAPVVFVSFADVKDPTLKEAIAHTKQILCAKLQEHLYLLDSDKILPTDRVFLSQVTDKMDEVDAKTCLQRLCRMLYAHWGIEPVILIDGYDVPLIGAWTRGHADEVAQFVWGLLICTLKDNRSMERALATATVHVTEEGLFGSTISARMATATTPLHEADFGLTQAEVDAALAEYGLAGRADEVRRWCGGHAFGHAGDVYGPWSVARYLQHRGPSALRADGSTEKLIGRTVRTHPHIMHDLEALLRGETVIANANQRIGLHAPTVSAWSLLLAEGHLCVVQRFRRDMLIGGQRVPGLLTNKLEFTLANRETEVLLKDMVKEWFDEVPDAIGSLAHTLMDGDTNNNVQSILTTVVKRCMSLFDTKDKPYEEVHLERFWHGLVLGMATELLEGDYDVRSNLESGLGRLDVTILPNDPALRACVLEFKVSKKGKPDAMERACADALGQIERKRYDEAILSRGVEASRISHFGIAFHGKRVLVRRG